MTQRGAKKHPMSLAKLKYARHKAQAKFRKIEFKFTFDQWYSWWLSQGIDKNQPQQYATEHDRMCMCRQGDQGAYEAANVYLGSAVKNVKDANENGRHLQKYKRHYRFGDLILDYRELEPLIRDIPKAQVDMYRVDRYDRLNVKETMKLVNRWRVYTKTHETRWTTTDGESFLTSQEAADHMQITKEQYLWMRQRGQVEKKRVLIALPLKDYIRKHSRYPDPYMPPDLE